MASLIDSTSVTISISGLDLAALKKISIVSHALASRLEHRAAQEQAALAQVLDDVIRRIELASADGRGREG